MTYIATFFSHFGAIKFKKICDSKNLPARMQPVPRSLSSSCGTCVQFEADSLEAFDSYPSETEKIVSSDGNGYDVLYCAKD